MLSKSKVKKTFKVSGFVFENTSGFGDTYKLNLDNGWSLTAYCSFNGNPFFGGIDQYNYASVDLHLHNCIGTSHICDSVESLTRNLLDIIEILTHSSNNEEILKCPKCKENYVRMIRPVAGEKWEPYLSCIGKKPVGNGKKKELVCNGISRKIPAIVYY